MADVGADVERAAAKTGLTAVPVARAATRAVAVCAKIELEIAQLEPGRRRGVSRRSRAGANRGSIASSAPATICSATCRSSRSARTNAAPGRSRAARRRSSPPARSTATSSAGFIRAEVVGLRRADRRAASWPRAASTARCGSKARNTSSRTATSSTSATPREPPIACAHALESSVLREPGRRSCTAAPRCWCAQLRRRSCAGAATRPSASSIPFRGTRSEELLAHAAAWRLIDVTREQRPADRRGDRHEVPDLLRAPPAQGRLAGASAPRRLRAVRHAVQRLRAHDEPTWRCASACSSSTRAMLGECRGLFSIARTVSARLQKIQRARPRRRSTIRRGWRRAPPGPVRRLRPDGGAPRESEAHRSGDRGDGARRRRCGW